MTPTAPIGTVRAPIDLNAAPKTRFRESGNNISAHRALVESREFERALDFSLLQYQRELSADVKDQTSALMAGYKLAGAQEFVRVLRTLSEVQSVKYTAPNDNLGS